MKIRVLRVIARLNIGGPAIHATLLAERLDPTRFESLLVAGSESAAEGSYLALHERQLANLTIIPELGRDIHPGRDLVTILRLYRLMRTFRPHIVHTHTAKAGAVGRIAARLARVPVVVHTYHGHVFHGYFSPARTRVFLAIERALARGSTRLLTVSESVRAELIRYRIAQPDRISVLPLGLDLARFLEADRWRGELRAELGIGDQPLVGLVARLVPIKRHEDFIEAAGLVARRRPDCRFLIVGDGERRAELETLVRQRGLSATVRFLGWRRDLDRIYADIDVVALTSANEGSPVSLIEAMAAGRPVASTAVGGVPDLVEHGVTGILTPPRDPAALAEAIVALLADPERRRQMGEAGRKRVYPAYDASRLVNDVEALYEELCEERRR